MHIARVDNAGVPLPPPQERPSAWFDTVFIIFNASFIIFYYLNTLVLIPRLLTRKYRMWYVLSILMSVVIIVSVPSLVIRVHYIDQPHHEGEYRTYLVLIRVLFTTLVFTIIFIVSTGMRIVKEWYQAERLADDIRHEKAITELSLLKGQINPHFLFNTLNNIYSLSVKKSDDAPQAVMMLADMMRYVLSDAQSEHVRLDKDLEHINEYIKLQKLRLTDKVRISYSIQGGTDDYEIAPLMLMPFVENAFKYGISTHEESTITIDIRIEDGNLSARIVNRVVANTMPLQKTTGTGLANVRRRLELLYPGRHTLTINPDENGNYSVYLHIKLT